MAHPFKANEDQLPLSSINHTLIVPLSSVIVPEKYFGKPASALLSSATLASDARSRKPACLGLSDEAAIQALEADLISQDEDLRKTAEDLCLAFGEKLAYLLLVLKRGCSESLSRKDWKREHWAYWAQRDRVILGGGLMAGKRGSMMLKGLRQVLSIANETMSVEIADHPETLCLIGLLKKSAIDSGNVLLFDFGPTFVKSACYHVQRGSVQSILRETTTPSGSLMHSRSGICDPVAALLNAILELIGDGWQKASADGLDPHTTIGISMAAYFSSNNPTSQNMYGALALASADLKELLQKRLTLHCNIPITILLMHDASAAAFPYKAQGHGVLLTLGAAIGVGCFDQ